MADKARLLEGILVGAGELSGPVSRLRRLSGGASRETWAFSAGERDLILRRDPPTVADRSTMDLEADCLRAAAGVGVPVPQVLASGAADGPLNASFMIMNHVSGEAVPRRLLRDPEFAVARQALARELGVILGRIHSVRPDTVPALPESDPLTDIRTEHDAYGEARPALEIAFRWLEDNRPDPLQRVLVHGDFRNGNLLVTGQSNNGFHVNAVLDWEMAHAGDPREDLGWLCAKAWRFGSERPVGGFGSRADLLDGYSSISGLQFTEDELLWWEVLATATWAVICRRQGEYFLGGGNPTIEKAVIGRRIAEAEHDLLVSIGGISATQLTDPLDVHITGSTSLVPHGRPSGDDLLAAVHRFLIDSAAPEHKFHARVAANAVQIARREALLGHELHEAHVHRLALLGCATDQELVESIRSGALEDRWIELIDIVGRSVSDKLRVSNPSYLSQPA